MSKIESVQYVARCKKCKYQWVTDGLEDECCNTTADIVAMSVTETMSKKEFRKHYPDYIL